MVAPRVLRNRLVNRFGEPALTVGTAIAAEPVNILAGLLQLDDSGVVQGNRLLELFGLEPYEGPATPSQALRRMEEVGERLTYSPRTPEGQAGLQSLKDAMVSVMDTLGVDEAINYFNTNVVPNLNRAFGEEATKEIGSAILMSAPFVRKVPDLPMDEASRMQRAQDMGFDDEPLYLGSTFDIEELDIEKMSPESYFGRAIYTTTSPDDASINYAGEGPDLTAKIEDRAEKIANETNRSYDDPRVLEQARSEVKGENLGVVYPLMGRSDQVFDLRRYGENTVLRYDRPEMDADDYIDEAKLNIYESDYDTPEEYNLAVQDRAQELADEDSFNFEPEGQLIDFMDAIRRDPRLSMQEADELIARINEQSNSGEGITAQQLNDVMRNTNFYAEDEAGNIVNSDVFRNALEQSGFDTILMDADTFNMQGVEDATHKIFLNPERLRSPGAEFDPDKIDSTNILSSILNNQLFRTTA